MGNFPGQPILPGVLQLEMMAQLELLHYELKKKIKINLLFLQVSKMQNLQDQYHQAIVSQSKTEFTGQKLGLGLYKAEIKRDGQKVSQAELTFALIDKNQ